MLLNITSDLKTTYLNPEEQQTLDKFYPFDPVLAKMRETLGHSNGSIRLLSQEVVTAIYGQFGFDQIKDFVNQTNLQSL